MLFCKKCGAQVNCDDLFCISCMARLDVDGAVVTREDISRKAAMEEEFSADSVITEANITGARILAHRLTEKTATFADTDYYRAVRADGTSSVDTTIRHIFFPNNTCADYSFTFHSLDRAETRSLELEYLNSVKTDCMVFSSNCTKAGVEPLNYNICSYSSKLYNKHHIFILMHNSLPLPLYVLQNKYTFRNVLEIGTRIAELLLRFRKNGIMVGAFSDDMLFLSADGKVYMDFNRFRCIGTYYPLCTEYQHYMQFMSPANENFEVYSLGMILFLLANGYRSPYINPYIAHFSGNDILTAEAGRRAMASPYIPEVLRNPVGDYIVRAISVGSVGLTLEEFHNVLLNSFNYVRADVLAEEILQTGESK